jgi:hypothetical protein
MSLGLGVVGFAASAVTFLDKQEAFWVRFARAYAIFHFALMELIQYFAYPVVDQCGYGTNYFLSELSTYHICLQALAIMPALATYSSDKLALKKATLLGVSLSGSFLIFSFMPKELQLLNSLPIFSFIPSELQNAVNKPNFIGDMIACLRSGKYHIAYNISSAFGSIVTHGSLFGLALSGFVWKDNKRIASYHFIMAIFTLFVPQWVFGVTTGEAAAIYCFYSIPITISFMPVFKKFFTAKPANYQFTELSNA